MSRGRFAIPAAAVSAARMTLLLTALLASAAGEAAPPLEKTHIDIATVGAVMGYLPVDIAISKGYFKDEGLDVERSMFPGGPKVLQSMLGGTADFGSSAYSNTLTMAAKNQKVVAVALMARYPGYVFGISSKSAAKFKSMKDLSGMKLGVTSPGSSNNLVLDYLASKAGVDLKSFSVIGVGAEAGAAAAVRQGQIDGLISVDPVITMLTDSHDLNVVADMRTASGVQAAFGSAQYPEAAILTTADFIAKNPHTVQAVVNAIVRAEKFLQTATPDEVTDALPTAYQLGNRQTFVAAYKNSQPIFSADGRFDPAGPVAVFNILSKFDKELADAKGRIDIPSTYTNRFVDAVRH
ncbi:ABC transporter substrate-binding protein [Paraburkholderia phytofirmans]|jgi:NitT/TauT family transport system substrate-binding protein|uniref:ABC transporter substrate-binding protein n=1 Tax=Paraburkholderia sp. BL9I2N2 TaxID=1938809 RepID=UPI00104B9F85|nr:ABC transporter substrate-binding protein [Paraburkholderia sp. BL9I2N2]TCK88296.1 NitT/TauT family transport system substrate-binding protein [Paraburkholderia sp. BL9I2N2]